MNLKELNPLQARKLINSRVDFCVEIDNSMKLKVFKFFFLQNKKQHMGVIPLPSLAMMVFYQGLSGIIYSSAGSSYEHFYKFNNSGATIEFIHHPHLTPEQIHVKNV